MRRAGIDGLTLCVLVAIGGCGAPPDSGSAEAEVVGEKELLLPASKRRPVLAGTLTWPTVGCPCPTAILLQGAGSHDRDYSLFGHKPFALLAQELARNGIATLRFDERGVGGSGGDPGTAAPPAMAGDVLDWMALLRVQPQVDPGRIGLVGHSEGGIVGSLVATRTPSLAFLVMLASPGLSGLEYNLQYEASVGTAMGLDEATVRSKEAFQSRVLTTLLEEEDRSRVEEQLRSLYSELPPSQSAEQVDAAIDHLLSPHFLFNLGYDPARTLEGIPVPVLAVFGERDMQVPPEGNAEALEAILDTDSGRDRVVTLPGLNHFMQTAPTGSPREYPLIQETMAPEVPKLIAGWIRTHTGPRQVGSCTVMMATDGERILGAANEDWDDSLTRLWIIPGSGGRHGWIKFGFAGGFPQAGMNDQGLFWDATGSPYLEMPESETTKSLYDGPLMVKVMEEAGTVTEAGEIFSSWYCEDQYRAQYLLGDAQGGSMIVEGDAILTRDGSFQVVTNFYQSHPELGGYPCGRFETANQMLGSADTVTPFLMGQVLDATHQNGKYPTQYSVIYDLPHQQLFLFHYHNFYEYLTLDLDTELAKGSRSYDIPPLFSRVRILEPEYQSTITGSSAVLRWEGRAGSDYEICFSDSPELGYACGPVQAQVAGRNPGEGILLSAVSILLLLVAVPAVGRTRRLQWGMVALTILTGSAACASSPTEPQEDPDAIVQMTHTVSGLQPGTTYYWKLRARAGDPSGFETETVTFSFTVTE